MPKKLKWKGTERKRRTAYRSGRLELIGKEKSPIRQVTRKVHGSDRNPIGSVVGRTAFKHKSWRRY